jgi:hypothetical protein
MIWNLWNCKPKQIFPSYKSIISNIFHSDRELTNTQFKQKMMDVLER